MLLGKSRIAQRQNKIFFRDMDVFYLTIINNSKYLSGSISHVRLKQEPLWAIHKSKKI